MWAPESGLVPRNNISCEKKDCHSLILKYQIDGDQFGGGGWVLQGGSFHQLIVHEKPHSDLMR